MTKCKLWFTLATLRNFINAYIKFSFCIFFCPDLTMILHGCVFVQWSVYSKILGKKGFFPLFR